MSLPNLIQDLRRKEHLFYQAAAAYGRAAALLEEIPEAEHREVTQVADEIETIRALQNADAAALPAPTIEAPTQRQIETELEEIAREEVEARAAAVSVVEGASAEGASVEEPPAEAAPPKPVPTQFPGDDLKLKPAYGFPIIDEAYERRPGNNYAEKVRSSRF